jgi:hypothetical protein
MITCLIARSAALLFLFLNCFILSAFGIIISWQSHGTTCTTEWSGHVEATSSSSRLGGLGLSHLSEHIFYLLVLSCASLDVGDASVLGAPSFGLVILHWAGISFIANKNEGERLWLVRCSVFQEVFLPDVESLEWFRVAQIENKAAGIWTTVEGVTKSIEFLLASSIPDLKIQLGRSDLELFGLEISSTNSRSSCAFFFTKSVDEGGFTNTTVS